VALVAIVAPTSRHLIKYICISSFSRSMQAVVAAVAGRRAGLASVAADAECDMPVGARLTADESETRAAPKGEDDDDEAYLEMGLDNYKNGTMQESSVMCILFIVIPIVQFGHKAFHGLLPSQLFLKVWIGIFGWVLQIIEIM
jgi:hypothetical protein